MKAYRMCPLTCTVVAMCRCAFFLVNYIYKTSLFSSRFFFNKVFCQDVITVFEVLFFNPSVLCFSHDSEHRDVGWKELKTIVSKPKFFFYFLVLVLTIHTKLVWPAKPTSLLHHINYGSSTAIMTIRLNICRSYIDFLLCLPQSLQKTSVKSFKMWPNHTESVTCENWATWTTS